MVYIQFTCILDYVLDNPCTICIPYVSGSFCWTEASAAALVGQGGLYILLSSLKNEGNQCEYGHKRKKGLTSALWFIGKLGLKI